jgi:hypothetical protein
MPLCHVLSFPHIHPLLLEAHVSLPLDLSITLITLSERPRSSSAKLQLSTFSNHEIKNAAACGREASVPALHQAGVGPKCHLILAHE